MQIEYCLGVALGDRIDIAGVLIKEGVSWETVSETLDARVPTYTTSLDAAIEGENIQFAVKSEKRERWGAMHRSRRRQEFLAWAASEPLARRLAALKGRRADLLIDRETTGQKEETDPKPTQRREKPLELTEALAEDDDETEEQDWKVLF